MYNTEPKAAGKSLLLPPVWEPAGAAMFAGKPAFIIGGASSVGQYGAARPPIPQPSISHSAHPAIQIAKLAGFSPIITTASLHNTALLHALGATHVLDRHRAPADLLAALPALTRGAPLEFAYDAISLPDTQPLAYAALAPGGRLVIVLHDRIPAALKAAPESAGKVIAHTFGNVHAPDNRAFGEAMFAQLEGWLAKGVIKVRRGAARAPAYAPVPPSGGGPGWVPQKLTALFAAQQRRGAAEWAGRHSRRPGEDGGGQS